MKTFSEKDIEKLRELVKEKWKDFIINRLKKRGKYEEFKKIAKNTVKKRGKYEEFKKIAKNTVDLQNLVPDEEISDRSWTDKLIDEKWPKDTIFPQYKKFEISDEERKRIEETQKAYYEPYYKRERERLTEDYTWSVRDINRLIQYSKSDLVNELAKANKTFARSMSKASNVYWQRWLLGSWIQKTQIWDVTEDFSKDIANREEYQRRKEEWLETRKANIKTKYERWLTEIAESQEAQIYFDTLKEIRNRQAEFIRQFWQSQENIHFWLTKPTTPTTAYTYKKSNNKALNSNYR